MKYAVTYPAAVSRMVLLDALPAREVDASNFVSFCVNVRRLRNKWNLMTLGHQSDFNKEKAVC